VLPACAGRLLARELEVLRKLLQEPARPATYVLGGAKVEDKVPVVEYILRSKRADKVLLGGVVSKVFLKAQGHKLNTEDEKALAGQAGPLESARRVMDEYSNDIVLPEDFAVKENGRRHCISAKNLAKSPSAWDIGDQSIRNFVRVIDSSKTVVGSGPLGVFEEEGFDAGTKETLTAMSNVDGFTVIGGGHLAGFASILGIGSRFTHVSTAGGAMLALLAGQELPAVKALVESARRYAKRK
jgi:phosphoglycerate kinase